MTGWQILCPESSLDHRCRHSAIERTGHDPRLAALDYDSVHERSPARQERWRRVIHFLFGSIRCGESLGFTACGRDTKQPAADLRKDDRIIRTPRRAAKER